MRAQCVNQLSRAVDARVGYLQQSQLSLTWFTGRFGVMMSRTHRRLTSMVGVAFGALLASPLIALCTGSVASADATDGSLDATPVDLDIFSGGPGSDTSEILFTVPSLFQVGIDDVDGVITPISSFGPFDAISRDIGLVDVSTAVA